MTIDIDRFKRMKDKVERLRTKKEQAVGAYKRELAQLKSDYDCDSIEEAKELLAEKKEKLRQVEGAYVLQEEIVKKALEGHNV